MKHMMETEKRKISEGEREEGREKGREGMREEEGRKEEGTAPVKCNISMIALA